MFSTPFNEITIRLMQRLQKKGGKLLKGETDITCAVRPHYIAGIRV